MTILVFILLAFGPLLVDLYHRRVEREPLGRAVKWSAIYISGAILFFLYLLLAEGPARASLFVSAYTIEKAMSMDNLIVFSAVFAYFGVRPEHEYRVLHWGIIGSAVLRLIFIGAGLIAFFVFGRILDLLFGIFVIWTAWKIFAAGNEEVDIDHHARWYIRLVKHAFPVSTVMNGQFFVKRTGILDRVPAATPLLFCLIAIEVTDIAFAFDSMPAVIGITRDTVLAYSAVMFAVVGLRSMYFVLAALKRYTDSLSAAVMGILCFVGVKMVIHGLLNVELPAWVTLFVIAVCVAAGIGAGLVKKHADN